jgi:tRNA threonylcarbamoyladenosine biosynthesis protein TsaE
MNGSACYLADEEATVEMGRLLALVTSTPAADGSPERVCTGGRLFLSGDLGAGKTTLTRGLLRGYGHQGAVKSPTYTLVEPYEETRYSIYHFDLYRINTPEEVEFLGVLEYFEEVNLCVVEWAEKGRGFLPAPDLELSLENAGPGRLIHWHARSTKGAEMARRLTEMTATWNAGP